MVRGSISQAQRAEVESHVDVCEPCRQLMVAAVEAAFASTDSPESDTTPDRYTHDSLLSRGAHVKLGTAAEVPTHPLLVLPGFMLGDRFEIQRPLGRGGMGIVYQAWDRALDLQVALKVLSPALAQNPSAMRRIRLEIVLARRIVHSSVCRVHDMGWHGKHPFITMELIEGETLAKIISRGEMDEESAVSHIAAIFDALSAIHEAGVVHRDVKPGNCMVRWKGDLVVMDFGLAVDAEKRSTASRGPVGTPAYWAPEQASGQPATFQSDIYSTGLVAREVLSLCGGTVAPAYAVPLARCLESQPEARFDTASEARDAFLAVRETRAASSSRRGVVFPALLAGAVVLGLAAGVVLARPILGQLVAEGPTVEVERSDDAELLSARSAEPTAPSAEARGAPPLAVGQALDEDDVGDVVATRRDVPSVEHHPEDDRRVTRRSRRRVPPRSAGIDPDGLRASEPEVTPPAQGDRIASNTRAPTTVVNPTTEVEVTDEAAAAPASEAQLGFFSEEGEELWFFE